MSESKENPMLSIVDRMVDASRQLSFHPGGPDDCRIELPSRSKCVDIMHQLRSVLFPGYFQLYEYSEDRIGFHVGAMMDRIAINLQEQIRRGFCFNCKSEGDIQSCTLRAESITANFLERIPDIMLLLCDDVQAAYEGDPAGSHYRPLSTPRRVLLDDFLRMGLVLRGELARYLQVWMVLLAAPEVEGEVEAVQ